MPINYLLFSNWFFPCLLIKSYLHQNCTNWSVKGNKANPHYGKLQMMQICCIYNLCARLKIQFFCIWIWSWCETPKRIVWRDFRNIKIIKKWSNSFRDNKKQSFIEFIQNYLIIYWIQPQIFQELASIALGVLIHSGTLEFKCTYLYFCVLSIKSLK